MDPEEASRLGFTEEIETIPEWYETGKMIPSRLILGPDMVAERKVRFIRKRRWVSGWEAIDEPR